MTDVKITLICDLPYTLTFFLMGNINEQNSDLDLVRLGVTATTVMPELRASMNEIGMVLARHALSDTEIAQKIAQEIPGFQRMSADEQVIATHKYLMFMGREYFDASRWVQIHPPTKIQCTRNTDNNPDVDRIREEFSAITDNVIRNLQALSTPENIALAIRAIMEDGEMKK